MHSASQSVVQTVCGVQWDLEVRIAAVHFIIQSCFSEALSQQGEKTNPNIFLLIDIGRFLAGTGECDMIGSVFDFEIVGTK